MEEHKTKVLEQFKSGSESAVILSGKMGTASWMAREIIEHATSNGFCYESIWVSVTKKFDTKLIYKVIYDQLSSGSIPDEWEYEDENSEAQKAALGLKGVTTVDWEKDMYQKAEHEVKEETEDSLKQKTDEQLAKRMTVLQQVAKYLLLVLDYEGSNMDSNELQQSISSCLPFFKHTHLKIIITRCDTGTPAADNNVQPINEIELGVLSARDSLFLFEEIVGHKCDGQLSEVIKNDGCFRFPALITVIGGALKYLGRSNPGRLDAALKKATFYIPSEVESLLYCAYDMITSEVTRNCFWHSLQFIGSRGGVHFNELITHWIMEGYFDPISQMEKTYQEAHRVMMELIDRAILKMQENNIVGVEGATLNMVDLRIHGFGSTANLGLFRAFGYGEGLGRVTHFDGMIRTLCNPKNLSEVSTLMIDGAYLDHEIPDVFFSLMPELKVLAVFNSTYKPLLLSLSSLRKLLVLVLRNCDLLDDATHIANHKTLRVLEISDSRGGASSLLSLSENLFDEMTHLQSLNLSGLQITSLPSLSNLRELRMLILRQCSQLEKLRSLRGLGNLEVLDLSDACLLEKFDDTSFTEMPNLQLIDFSKTKIQKLPVIGELTHLKQILLKGCDNKLNQLPKLQQLTNLQILDLSGVIDFRDFKYGDSIDGLNHLKILNLSETKVKRLRRLPCNLSELHLSGCSELEELPSLASLKNLELLDVSGALNLTKIVDKSFEHLSFLRCLNFSNTKVKQLPSLSNLSNLCELLLVKCTSLANLPDMEGLKRLEKLDLTGCSALGQVTKLINDLKTHMPQLQVTHS